MSIKVLGIELTELSKRELYAELARNFSFIGFYRECERLEEMWSDPVYKKAVEEYIKAWLEFRRKKRVVEAYTLLLQRSPNTPNPQILLRQFNTLMSKDYLIQRNAS